MYGLWMAATAAVLSDAQAARPLLTDDARVIDDGGCQLESWVQRARGEQQAWALPACSAGAGSEWAAGAWRAIPRGSSETGSVFQYKRVLKEMQPGGWGMAVTLGTLAQGGALQPFINFPLTWLSAREALALHVNVGRAAQDGSVTAHWTRGLALEQRLSTDWWLIAEHHVPTGTSRLWQVGIRWWIWTDRLQLDATRGVLTMDQRNAPAISIGLRWVFDGPGVRTGSSQSAHGRLP
jgi:hypothetical protein